MMSSAFILSCLVLLVLAQLVFSIQLQPHQQAIVFGFDKRRSGDLVVTQEPSDADVYVIFPSTPSSTSTSLSSVPLTALSSLSAASIGIDTPSTSSFPHVLLQSHLLKRDAASLHLQFNGIDRDMISAFGLVNLQQLISEHPSCSVSDVPYPLSFESTIVTAATGVQPSQHGIIAPHWADHNSDSVSAFSKTEGSTGRSATMADILAKTFPDSVIISASSSRMASSAMSTHNDGTNVHNICLDLNSCEDQDDQLKLSLDAVKKFASELASTLKPLPKSIKSLSYSKGVVSVVLQDEVAVDLDLKEPSVLNLFSELAFALSLQSSIGAHDSPHLIYLSFASIESIRSRFGLTSPQHRSSLLLLDAFLPIIISHMSSLYGGRLHSQLLLVRVSDSALFDEKIIQDIKDAATENQVDVDLSHLPSIYVKSSGTAVNLLQSALQNSLGGNVRVFRPSLLAADPAANDVDMYQVTLWLSVMLVVLLVWAVYSLAFMSNTRDALLYAKFNPSMVKKTR